MTAAMKVLCSWYSSEIFSNICRNNSPWLKKAPMKSMGKKSKVTFQQHQMFSNNIFWTIRLKRLFNSHRKPLLIIYTLENTLLSDNIVNKIRMYHSRKGKKFGLWYILWQLCERSRLQQQLVYCNFSEKRFFLHHMNKHPRSAYARLVLPW